MGIVHGAPLEKAASRAGERAALGTVPNVSSQLCWLSVEGNVRGPFCYSLGRLRRRCLWEFGSFRGAG